MDAKCVQPFRLSAEQNAWAVCRKLELERTRLNTTKGAIQPNICQTQPLHPQWHLCQFMDLRWNLWYFPVGFLKRQLKPRVMSECRLIYKSLSTDDFVSNETVKDIAEKGASNNKKQNITGLLVLSGNQFLQVLEGPTPEVNALFRKISGDERHTQVHLLHYELIQYRQFEDWSMRLVDLWDIPGSVREFVRSKYRCVEDIIQIPSDAMGVHALLLDARALSR